uniref:Putative secreted protein n=1 Tax=Anopheles darlingi TaxID=43151 RepID=A0A2M4DRD7_ANODA
MPRRRALACVISFSRRQGGTPALLIRFFAQHSTTLCPMHRPPFPRHFFPRFLLPLLERCLLGNVFHPPGVRAAQDRTYKNSSPEKTPFAVCCLLLKI